MAEEEEENECPVCKESGVVLEPWRGRHRQCGHAFCTRCTLRWFQQKRDPRCPMCRNPALNREEDDEYDDYYEEEEEEDDEYDDYYEEEEEEGLGLHVIDPPPSCDAERIDKDNDRIAHNIIVSLLVILGIACIGVLFGVCYVYTRQRVDTKRCPSGYDHLDGECRVSPSRYGYWSASSGGAIAIGHSARASAGWSGAIAIGHASRPLLDDCIPARLEMSNLVVLAVVSNHSMCLI